MTDHSPQSIIEGIILRRIYEKRIEGYTIETAKEIAEALAAVPAKEPAAWQWRYVGATEWSSLSHRGKLLMTDTVKHMWDQVEKARADGTFSSEHAAVPAQDAGARSSVDSAGTEWHVIFDQCAQIVRSFHGPIEERAREGLISCIQHFKGLYAKGLSAGATADRPAPGRLTPQNTAERVPSSDAALLGAGSFIQKIRSIADDCREDFNTCPQCGYEDRTAIKNSNLLLLIDSALETASRTPAVQERLAPPGSPERTAELQYEAGMYESLYLAWKERAERAEAQVERAKEYADAALGNAAECSRLEVENTLLRNVHKAASVYYGCYVQDEEIECCISPEQHEAAKALRDALKDASKLSHTSTVGGPDHG